MLLGKGFERKLASSNLDTQPQRDTTFALQVENGNEFE